LQPTLRFAFSRRSDAVANGDGVDETSQLVLVVPSFDEPFFGEVVVQKGRGDEPVQVDLVSGKAPVPAADKGRLITTPV
jgi:hypothetical protein